MNLINDKIPVLDIVERQRLAHALRALVDRDKAGGADVEGVVLFVVDLVLVGHKVSVILALARIILDRGRLHVHHPPPFLFLLGPS